MMLINRLVISVECLISIVNISDSEKSRIGHFPQNGLLQFFLYESENLRMFLEVVKYDLAMQKAIELLKENN